MNSLTLHPLKSAKGEIQLPGSKSLSNRILLLAAQAKGVTTITNLLDSDDIRRMLESLDSIGVQFELSDDKTTCKVTGQAGPLKSEKALELFLGNAGTAMRPLAAALCLGEGEFTLTGEPRMYERPIGDLIDALLPLGANVEYLGDKDYPPLKIKATGINGGEVKIKGNISSQFLTALLMAAPMAKGDLTIVMDGELVSKPYIDITLDCMARFGITVENDNYQRFTIKGNQTYSAPETIMVEGDASSASYFLSLGALGGGPVRVHGTGLASIQGDAQYAKVLEQMGAKITWSDFWIQAEAPENGAKLQAVDVDLNHIPDAAMTIATTALFATGTTKITNIYNWRVKETDRLNAMATELTKLGATVVEGNDYIEVTPPAEIQSAAIDTYDDHRIAMCFSLAAFGNSDIIINDPGCTSKTFPTYFELFKQVTIEK
ncbi:3-phosphoshikimate 1-carboxyvinyltransferase [Marinicellulosiphila megalodicopiae]|uniref:3-phosphoshikimate 1-carboxyvinyltransferase n=1 Tax=Marinicellulosiphila megalodicopiae TaxID=2724896 RepID=UPI003BB04668